MEANIPYMDPMLFERWQDLKPDEPRWNRGFSLPDNFKWWKKGSQKCHFQKQILTWSGWYTLHTVFHSVSKRKVLGWCFPRNTWWVYFFWCWSPTLNASNELGWFVKHQILRSHHRGDQIFWCSGYSLLWALFGSTAVGLGMSLGNHSWCLFFPDGDSSIAHILCNMCVSNMHMCMYIYVYTHINAHNILQHNILQHVAATTTTTTTATTRRNSTTSRATTPATIATATAPLIMGRKTCVTPQTTGRKNYQLVHQQ